MTQLTEAIHTRRRAEAILSEMVREELILQGSASMDDPSLHDIHIFATAADPKEDATVTLPEWNLYLSIDNVDVDMEAVQNAMHQAVMRVPMLAEQFHHPVGPTPLSSTRALMDTLHCRRTDATSNI